MASFATGHAQQTYVPDDAFEQALIDKGYDNVLDDYVTTANISGVTHLDVSPCISCSNGNIQDLTGIEGFTALEELFCGRNKLNTLDLSQNTALKKLYCWDNQLTSVDISQCTLLEILEVNMNQLTILDVSQNTALTNLLCGQNNLTNLNLTQNVDLKIVDASNNQLSSVDIRNGNNYAIKENATSTFNVKNNPNLICIFVDDSIYSAANWPNIDPASTFVETQEGCDALGLNKNVFEKIKIYPNPVNTLLHIDSEFRIQDSELVLTSILGKKIYQATISGREIEINLSHLKAGIYFLTIQNREKQSLTTKIIKL